MCRDHESYDLPLAFASILAVTGTGPRVVISALPPPSIVVSGGSSGAVRETSHTGLAEVVELGVGALRTGSRSITWWSARA